MNEQLLHWIELAPARSRGALEGLVGSPLSARYDVRGGRPCLCGSRYLHQAVRAVESVQIVERHGAHRLPARDDGLPLDGLRPVYRENRAEMRVALGGAL